MTVLAKEAGMSEITFVRVENWEALSEKRQILEGEGFKDGFGVNHQNLHLQNDAEKELGANREVVIIEAAGWPWGFPRPDEPCYYLHILFSRPSTDSRTSLESEGRLIQAIRINQDILNIDDSGIYHGSRETGVHIGTSDIWHSVFQTKTKKRKKDCYRCACRRGIFRQPQLTDSEWEKAKEDFFAIHGQPKYFTV